jgi:hypothetical protein
MEIVHEAKRYLIAGGCWHRQRDQERRQALLAKAENELKRLAAVKRKKVNPQKLGGVAPRMAESGPAFRRSASQTSFSPRACVNWA